VDSTEEGTILILDQENYVRRNLKALLEGEGYVSVAMDGSDLCVNEIREGKIAGIIAGYWIGDERTFDVIRQLKGLFPEIYVMMVSAEPVAEDEYERIFNAGVDDFFVKPFSARKTLLHLRKGLKFSGNLLERKRLEGQLLRDRSSGPCLNAEEPEEKMVPLPPGGNPGLVVSKEWR